MSRPKIMPKNEKRPFAMDELFFSTTDRAGVILSGNEIFRRVAAFATIEEMIGRPHNIIRHPDTPRAVFQLLWDYLGQRKTICAYIKNMAQDGGYYWVYALVVPVHGGFLSIRFNPSSPTFGLLQEIYAEMRAIETEYGDAPKVRDIGMAKASELLLTRLRAEGFADYDAFMQYSLATEMGSRALVLSSRSSTRALDSATDALSEKLAECVVLETVLDRMFLKVETFLALIGRLEKNSQFLNDLARNISRHALNSLIACHKFGNQGRSLAVVAENLSGISQESMSTITLMIGSIGGLVAALRKSAFSISAAKLEVEISIFFLRELIERRVDGEVKEESGDVQVLAHSLEVTIAEIFRELPHLELPIGQLTHQIEQLDETIRALSAVHLIGQIETARLNGTQVFHQLFHEISTQIEAAGSLLKSFSAEISVLSDGLPSLEGDSRTLVDHVATAA